MKSLGTLETNDNFPDYLQILGQFCERIQKAQLLFKFNDKQSKKNILANSFYFQECLTNISDGPMLMEDFFVSVELFSRHD